MEDNNNVEYNIDFSYFYEQYGTNEYTYRMSSSHYHYYLLTPARGNPPFTNDEILEIHRREYLEQKTAHAKAEIVRQIERKVRRELGFDSLWNTGEERG